MSTEFNVGDYVSFYGGEGTVVEVSGDKLQVLTNDGTMREVASTQPMLKKVETTSKGDLVNFPGGQARVVSVQERSGRPDLFYLRTKEGDLKKVPADTESLEPGMSIPKRLSIGEFDDPVRFSLRERAVRLSLAYRSDRFLSLSGNRIRIEPYQVEAAHKVLSAYEPRFLIADEVGLGKTIEAGIIIEELIARDRADRVLIITPASLRDQWQREMKEKFGREYVPYDRGNVKAQRGARPGKNVWTADDKIVVSIDFAKQDDMLEDLRNLDVSWDAVVVDEAHHLTARQGSDGIERVDRYRVGEAVADNTDALLFLTGTPHKGKPYQFYYLLRLLDPYRFRGPEDINPDQLEDLMIRRVKTDDSMIDADGEPMFPEREITTLPVELTEEERQLYDDLTEYISAVYTASAESDRHTAGFTMVIYQKRLVSSIRAISESLQSRKEDLDEKISVSEDIAKRLHNVDSSVETEEDILDQLIDAARDVTVDSKGKRLREFLDSIFKEDPDEKVLLFTEYTDTLEYLREDVLADFNTVEIHGGMNQEDRRAAINQFRDGASILLATDAAREGLNLQFAHIMVNYDLPWNPIRIDQRMGRLHRYGQDEDVKIYNLFVEDTRESDILQLLVNKIDQIESDLGMRSDVLGTVLDDYDVEGAIMDAVTGQRSSSEVQRDIENAIEERKDAVERIEKEFLIRDKFDAEDRDEIENLIDLSEERPIGEDDIEQLVRQFCYEFGGEVSEAEVSNEHGHSLYRVEVPDIISMNSDVQEVYTSVTFSRSVALDVPSAELVSLNHLLIQEIIDYCLDGDWIDGQAAGLVAQNPDSTPGVLATYRLGYVSGDGEVPTEDYTRVYIDSTGTVHGDIPDIIGALPSPLATAHPESFDAAKRVSESLERGEEAAREVVNELVDDVREERQKDVEIKEEHAERYFQQKIRELEDRLRKYEKEEQDTDKDMRVAIRSTRKELEDVEQEWEEEQERLERERMVMPDNPELVNAAVVTGLVPALDLSGQPTADELCRAIDAGDEDVLSFVPPHDEIDDVFSLAQDPARLLRPVGFGTVASDLTAVDIADTTIWVDEDVPASQLEEQKLTEFENRLSDLVSNVAGGVELELCQTASPVDAIHHQGKILFNIRLDNMVTDAFWQVVTAREIAFSDSQLPAERRIERIQRLLDGL